MSESGLKKLAGKIEDIGRDLMHLEVNTILSDNIVGGKMPDPYHAIIDISKDFRRELVDDGFPPSDDAFLSYWKAESHIPSNERPQGEDLQKLLSGQLHGYVGFDILRECAKRATSILEKKVPVVMETDTSDGESIKEKIILLHRIEEMSDALKGILGQFKRSFSRKDVVEYDNSNKAEREAASYTGLPDLDLTTNETSLLRKIFEIRTEKIVMQTVIGMDGDVISRVSREVVYHPNSALLQKLHNLGVTTSIDFWKDLINLVSDFFRSFVGSASK